MLQPLLTPLPRKSEFEEFSQDARDFFGERRAGHMSRWLYATAEFAGDKADGAGAWIRAINEARNGSPYYVFQKERDAISSFAPCIPDFIHRHARIVDMGPGSIDAVHCKIMPLIEQASGFIKEYVAVDICTESASAASAEIKKHYPFARTDELHKDFIQDSFVNGRTIEQEATVLFGLTLCNMPIDPRVAKLPELCLMSSFRRLKQHHAASDSYLIITQDTNQDVETLKAAYLALREHYSSVLYRIQRDLHVVGDYDPKNFVMGVDYFEETQACALYFETTKKMNFWVEGEQFQIAKGEKLYFHNAFKFNKPTFLSAAQKAGYSPVFTQEESDNPCMLHVLKAV